jgi:hypothetical protein
MGQACASYRTVSETEERGAQKPSSRETRDILLARALRLVTGLLNGDVIDVWFLAEEQSLEVLEGQIFDALVPMAAIRVLRGIMPTVLGHDVLRVAGYGRRPDRGVILISKRVPRFRMRDWGIDMDERAEHDAHHGFCLHAHCPESISAEIAIGLAQPEYGEDSIEFGDDPRRPDCFIQAKVSHLLEISA